MQESLNVMYFFDESSHGWLPMPLSWERQTPFVSRLVSETKVNKLGTLGGGVRGAKFRMLSLTTAKNYCTNQ